MDDDNLFHVDPANSVWNLSPRLEEIRQATEMKVIVDLCVVPMGVGVSVSKYVTECQNVLNEAGLEHQLHAYGTNIEGDWDNVFAAIKRCHERVHGMGALRITTSIKVGTRTDREQTMQEKIDSVTEREV
ncbi:MAG: MTH1187 family thiamine-binding protein [Rubripirellula sp.]|nr:MTH1187 family thiamine-binding protein [Rubripirellula sp.]